ncbi:MAG: hypothetical protein IKZ02_03885 [Alphaproteobacteria bacterium]|nr:hypothetical protein [Alphaproteobacteria bacterium]
MKSYKFFDIADNGKTIRDKKGNLIFTANTDSDVICEVLDNNAPFFQVKETSKSNSFTQFYDVNGCSIQSHCSTDYKINQEADGTYQLYISLNSDKNLYAKMFTSAGKNSTIQTKNFVIEKFSPQSALTVSTFKGELFALTENFEIHPDVPDYIILKNRLGSTLFDKKGEPISPFMNARMLQIVDEYTYEMKLFEGGVTERLSTPKGKREKAKFWLSRIGLTLATFGLLYTCSDKSEKQEEKTSHPKTIQKGQMPVQTTENIRYTRTHE